MPQTPRNEKLAAILKSHRQYYYLRHTHSIVMWDHRVQMPPGGEALRANQLAQLSTMLHEMITAPDYSKWVGGLDESELDDAVEQAQLREAKRAHRRATSIDSELVHEMSLLTAKAHEKWIAARSKNDFSIFAPALQEVVDVKRREAAILVDKVGFSSKYDALVNDFEPDMPSSMLSPLFDELKGFLQRNISEFASAHASAKRAGDLINKAAADGVFTQERQKKLGEQIIAALGFDFERGRVDASAHPFCTGERSDARLTTRYSVSDPLPSLMALIHEAGHGMYAQGLDPELVGTPAGDPRSMGVHESQSKLWENHVARSGSFWKFALPLFKQAYPHKAVQEIQFEDMLAHVNCVRQSLIRVDADEVTYPLHIILRYELEQKLVNGQLQVKELPAAWNEASKTLLNLTPPSDNEGILQDIHWSMGIFGYFPTYLVGILIAAQLFRRAKSELGQLDEQIASGQFSALKGWLNEKIHSQASLWTTPQLVKRASGSELAAASFKDYISAKRPRLSGDK